MPISQEILQRLKDLFFTIAQREEEVELLRQRLCQFKEFAPGLLFSELNTTHRGISNTELMNFMWSHGTVVTQDDAKQVVQQYGTKKDGRISYEDFMQVVLPATAPSLRSIAIGRVGVSSSEVEIAFVELMQAEIVYHCDVEAQRRELVSACNFEVDEIFDQLTKDKPTLLRWDLQRIIGVSFTPRMISAVLRRCDHDWDEALSSQEFLEAISPKSIDPFVPVRSHIDTGSSEILVTMDQNYSFSRTPIKRMSVLSQPKMGSTDSAMTQSVPRPRADSRLSSSQLMTHMLTPSPTRSVIQPENAETFEENAARQIATAFNSLLMLEADAERAREALSLANDFNLNRLFDIFDPFDKGYINQRDVVQGLSQIGVYTDEIEARLVIKRYSGGHCQLNFNEFWSIFIPKDDEYVRILEYRTRDELDMAQETEVKLQNMLRIVIQTEAFANQMRISLSSESVNLTQAFKYIDVRNRKIISETDLLKFLNANEFQANNVIKIVERYDKTRSGSLTYGEWIKGLKP